MTSLPYKIGNSSFLTEIKEPSKISTEKFELILSFSQKIFELLSQLLYCSLEDEKTTHIVECIKISVDTINNKVSTLIGYDKLRLRFDPDTTSLICERRCLGLEIIKLHQQIEIDRQIARMN